MSSPKVGFVSLGCPKALVDSERILTQLRTEGYAITPVASLTARRLNRWTRLARRLPKTGR
jgi:tRNA A37 methylthiotransferase MiaB